MHLQQTKAASRATGGPQYYFHDVPEHVKEFLRKRGACPVVLQTPYGLAATPFMAVGRDHKLSAHGKAVAGKVGHDRIQQAGGEQSIGEAVRYWYGVDTQDDFETIGVDAHIHAEGHFILVPTAIKMRRAKRDKAVEKVTAPLSFHHDYQSKFWRQQIDARRKESSQDVAWAAAQMTRVVADHQGGRVHHILESDLLRAGGALSLLGMDLSAYLGKGYDCAESAFQFSGLPLYRCPVEVKKRSEGFTYQVTRYKKLPRAVVLCMKHTLVNPPEHIDFIELPTLAEYLSR